MQNCASSAPIYHGPYKHSASPKVQTCGTSSTCSQRQKKTKSVFFNCTTFVHKKLEYIPELMHQSLLAITLGNANAKKLHQISLLCIE
ncbi:hypothetical protein FKM82_008137 [Ascaphus truei]